MKFPNNVLDDRTPAEEERDRVYDARIEGDQFGEPAYPAADEGRRTRRVLLGAAIGLVLVVLIGAFALRGGSGNEAAAPAAASAPAPAPVPVSTAAAVVRELPVYIEATGTLTPYEATDVAPETSGQVVSTPVDVGDFVRGGQVLAKLDARDAQLRLQQAEAALAQAQASVRQSRERLGQRPGEQFDPNRVAEVEAARAEMELAAVNERRYRVLAESGDVARAQYDEARVRAETARRQYETALAAARSGGAGVDVASANLEAARAQVAMAKKAVADTTIVAPLDGYIAGRPVAAGEWITTQSTVASLVQTGTLKLELTVAESDAAQIRVGLPVALRVDSYPGREFRGLVTALAPSLDVASRSLVAIVEVSNPGNELRPGMFATARVLQPNEGRRGVVIPREAVVPASGQSYRVFVISDGRAEARVVQLGQQVEGLVHVVEGVKEGEEVAVSGIDSLTDGAPVIR
jgi:multidrug efflux pump subunit AcrA (membrane-fusion protein)